MSKKTPKPKKKHKGLIIFLVIFSILVVFPVGFIFGAFYTTDTKPVSNSEVTYQNIVSKAFYNGVKGLTETDHILKFTIDEEMFDGILMAACEKIGQPQYIPKMYCYVKDNNYTFVIDLQASFFKSRIQIHTTLNKDGDTLVFKITGITLGRLPIPLNWITSILGNFINDEMLNNAFSKSGFHIQSHLSETKLTYSREQFKVDAGEYMEKLGSNNPFLQMLLPVLGDEEHEIFSTNYQNGITASFDLNKLELSEGKYKKTPPLKFTDLDNHKDKIIEWLNDGYLAEEDVEKMFAYLVRGHESISEDIIPFINTINANEEFKNKVNLYTGADNLESYRGGKLDGYSNFAEYYGEHKVNATFKLEEVTPPEIPSSVTFSVDTESLNQYLAFYMNAAIGKTIPITFIDDKGKWGFEYLLVDNLYLDFVQESEDSDPKLIMYLILNISGVQLGLALETGSIKIEAQAGSYGKFEFELQNIHFGSIVFEKSSGFLDPILKLIPLESEGFAYKEGVFSLNLDNIIGHAYDDDKKQQIIDILIDESTIKSKVENEKLNITYTKNS